MADLRRKGFSLIEVMIVVVIISLFILIAIWAYQQQLAKGRDAKRKADLDRLQNILEDYIGDNVCYPERDEVTSDIPGVSDFKSICGSPFPPYLSQLPCDPKNNIHYNYFYSNSETETCKSWYKIYTRLEYEKDPIIEEVGCLGGCGPSYNYNYWVSSPNVAEVAQLAGEWWPGIPGVTPPPEGSPTPTPGASPTPTPTPGASPTPTPTLIPCGDGGFQPTCWNEEKGWYCVAGVCSTCCPGVEYRCGGAGSCCFLDFSCGGG